MAPLATAMEGQALSSTVYALLRPPGYQLQTDHHSNSVGLNKVYRKGLAWATEVGGGLYQSECTIHMYELPDLILLVGATFI